MARVKPVEQVSKKWARVTPQRVEDYEIGVRNPRAPWAASAMAAEGRYQEGVTAAIQQKRYGKGVQKAGDQGWQSKTLAKGPARFSEGVAIGEPDYAAAVAPYLETIKATTLPPRFAKGDPRNIERVKVMAAALRKKKTG